MMATEKPTFQYGDLRTAHGTGSTQQAASYLFSMGQNGDKPAVGDYDGDGRSDFAAFRLTTSVWYLQRTTRRNFDNAMGTGTSSLQEIMMGTVNQILLFGDLRMLPGILSIAQMVIS